MSNVTPYFKFIDSFCSSQNNIQIAKLILVIIIMMRSFNLLPRFRTISTPLNTLLCRQSFPFCESAPPPPVDELASYQKFLEKFNTSIRKPHEHLRGEEERIIQQYITQNKSSQLITFLSKNCSRTLADRRTAPKLDEYLTKQWHTLTEEQRTAIAFALVQLREEKFFGKFKKPIEEKLLKEGITSVPPEQLVVFLYGELVNRKSLRFMGKLHAKVPDRKEIYEKIYNYLDKQKVSSFKWEKRGLLQYIALLLDPTLNKKEESIPDRPRSSLETNVEAFLGVMGIQFERQVRINEFFVDYLVRGGTLGCDYILEVNGNQHYTIGEKLKGENMLRNLIVNEYAPLRILHVRDLMASKGNRNKMAYIESLFTKEKMINWEFRKEGTNKQWELKLDQRLYDQVRPE